MEAQRRAVAAATAFCADRRGWMATVTSSNSAWPDRRGVGVALYELVFTCQGLGPAEADRLSEEELLRQLREALP